MSTNTGKARGRDRSTAATATPPVDDRDALRADIAHTRTELGDSVQALAERTDVKARTKEKVAEVKQQAAEVTDRAKDTAHTAAVRARETGQQAATTVRRRPAPYAGAVAGLVAAVGVVVFVRRRRAAKARARRWWPR